MEGPILAHPPLPDFWRAPLVPVALAVTTGILLDRWLDLSSGIILLGLGLSFLAWVINLRNRSALVYLWLAAGILGAFWQHEWRTHKAADDISHFAALDARLARVRGIVASEPVLVRGPPAGPLRSFSAPGSAFGLAVHFRATSGRRRGPSAGDSRG
jgi:competence protein ComEC